MITFDSLDIEHMSDQELGNLLIDAKKAYYTTGKPIMDDHTYDTLEDILLKKNPHHRLFSKVGNPNFDTGWTKQKHLFPLGSQNKVSTYKDLVHYFDLKKLPTNTNFVVQPKCDGLSVALNYKSGQLESAVTRGDGFEGDLITQNIVYMKNLPKKITSKDSLTVRCEILVTSSDFAKLNKITKQNYTNPRNAASGISQRLDSLYSNFCSLYAVDIFSNDINFDTEQQKINFLKRQGFICVDSKTCKDYSQINSIYKKFLNQDRQTYSYEIDGLVIKINQTDIQTKLGSLNNRPKGQVAYKFPADSFQTNITNIKWQVGPLGTITPVAHVAPVNLSGATIKKASLANYKLLKAKNINIGDIVKLSRRGDVIPYIEKVVTKVNRGHATIPKTCPACHTPLIVEDKFLICPNYQNCSPQIIGRLNLFCKKLDILGISQKTIKKLFKKGLLKNPADFYMLKIEDISPIDGLGDKSATNFLFQIKQKTNLSLIDLFTSVSIPELSTARLKQIIKAGFNTPQKILNIKVGDLENLPGFQATLSQKIVKGISQRKEIITKLLKQINLKKLSINQNLSNLSFVITGALSKPRVYFKKLIEQAGGSFSSSLSKNTSYLVTNQANGTSSKISKAKKLNIPIIDENKLISIINSKQTVN